MKSTTTTSNNSKLPAASSFVVSLLRNHIRLQLNASVSDVWSLIGNLSRFPEYSDSLQKVETVNDPNGKCIAYVCHFKPQEPDGEGISHRAFMKWYELNKGWASLDEEPNEFGLSNSLTIIKLEPATEGSILTWDMHYDAQDIEMNKSSLELALKDIAERLTKQFGGKIVESFVEGRLNKHH
jgi:hypothetical protein